ncbi:MAG TPA: hypothetical protein VF941_03165 [Clostridia bacterium]
MATSSTSGNRDANRNLALIVENVLGTDVLYPTGVSLTNAVPMHVAVVDASGNQITSFGGSGGNAAASATGAAVPADADYIGFNSAGNLVGVSSSAPLPITIISGNPTSITANAGTNLNTSALALETGGNLAAIKADVDKIPSQGQALAAASMPVVLPAAQITTLTPPTNTGYALDSSLSTINTSLADVATIGAKTDAKSTATDATSVSMMSVLKEISAMVQAPPSTPVTGTFWQATQPVSLASLPALASGTNVIGHVIVDSGTITTVSAVTAITNALPAGTNLMGKVGIDQTTIGTTNGVTPVPSSAGGTGWQFKQFGDGTVGTDWNGTKQQIVGTAATFGGYVMIFNPNTATSFIQIFNKTSANVTLGTTVPDLVIPIPGVASASATGAAANNELVHGIKFSTALTVAITTTAGGLTAPSSKCYGCILYN